MAVVAVLLFLLLFEPGLPYRVQSSGAQPDSPEFLDAELAAIRGARRSIHLEAYLFLRGRVADEVLAALEERARAGVRPTTGSGRRGAAGRGATPWCA